MLFGRINNKYSENLFHCALTLLFFSVGVGFVGCQSSAQKTAANTEDCVALINKNDFQNAEQCYLNLANANADRAENIKKAGAEAIFEKCGALRKQPEYETAAECYKSVTSLTEKNANAYFLLAHSYLETAKIAARVAEANPEVLVENITKRNENLTKSESAVKKGLELNPKDAWGYSIYGDILVRNGKEHEAVENYRQAVNLSPESELYRINLGKAQEKNSPSEAIETYKQALKTNPNSKPALYYLGSLYVRELRGCEAVETLEKLKALDANYDDANEKLEKLYGSFDIEKQCGKSAATKSVGAGKGNGNKP